MELEEPGAYGRLICDEDGRLSALLGSRLSLSSSMFKRSMLACAAVMQTHFTTLGPWIDVLRAVPLTDIVVASRVGKSVSMTLLKGMKCVLKV